MKKRHIGRVSVSADFIGHIGLYTIGYILGISINEIHMRKLHIGIKSVSADYAIVISVSASVSADMKIRYISGYRYWPIWKNSYRLPITMDDQNWKIPKLSKLKFWLGLPNRNSACISFSNSTLILDNFRLIFAKSYGKKVICVQIKKTHKRFHWNNFEQTKTKLLKHQNFAIFGSVVHWQCYTVA